MNELGFEFEHPWVLLLLALLPLYAWLRGKSGQAAALLYPDVGLLRAVSKPVREAAGSLRLFLRLVEHGIFHGPRDGRGELDCWD